MCNMKEVTRFTGQVFTVLVQSHSSHSVVSQAQHQTADEQSGAKRE